jgi:periplasmic protein TonB
MLPVAQQKLSFFDLLVSEVNHRTFVGLLAVLVLLLHLLLMIWLLQPDDNEKPTKPLKIIEVALLSEPNPVVNTPPAPPPKPVPVKTVTPKKKPVKPVIKKKEPVV